MRFVHLVALAAVAGVVAACSGSGATTPPATPLATSSPAAAATRVEVKLTDALRIEPSEMTVAAAREVTFVVTNTGAIEHEFFVGDEAAQAAHEKEMAGTGGMSHGDPMGVTVKPGQTMELKTTLARPGVTLAGCHVAGHYAGGMKATIRITA